MKNVLRFGAFCAGLALPAFANAQEVLLTITIYGNRTGGSLTAQTAEQAEREIQQTPGSVNIVPDTQFRLQRSATIKDVLDYVPGVFTQPKWGEDSRLSIRGSGLSRNFHLRGVQLFMDGIPTNTANSASALYEPGTGRAIYGGMRWSY